VLWLWSAADLLLLLLLLLLRARREARGAWRLRFAFARVASSYAATCYYVREARSKLTKQV
jgi:hypothetical protein